MRAGIVLVIAFGTACGGEPPAPATGGEVRAFLTAMLPVGAVEGPVLLPAELRVTATPPDAREPVTMVLPVTARRATGRLVLERRRSAERWRLRGAAAVAGDTLFRVVDDLEVRADAPQPDVVLRLIYDGRDAAMASLALAPRDTSLAPGAAFRVRARGEDPLGGTLAPPLGWRSRTPAVATVDDAGRVTAVAAGEAWIVGRSWTGMADSVRVVVRQAEAR